MTTSEWIDKQREFCKPNLHVIFTGAIPVVSTTVGKYSKDHLRLDLEFREIARFGRKFHISIANHMGSGDGVARMAAWVYPLCESLGCDIKDIPPLSGWEEGVEELGDETHGLLAPHRGKKVFIKLVIDEKGHFMFGSDRSVSVKPDMFYSEKDLRFLELQPENLATLDHDTQFME